MKCIYLLKTQNKYLYKIGFTKNKPEDRIKKLQTGNGILIELVTYYNSEHARKIEKTLHRLYNHKKYIIDDFTKLDGEWFMFEEINIKNEFLDICRKIEENILILERNKI